MSSALGVHCEGIALGETLTLLEQQLEVMAEGLVGFEQVQLALSQARANTIENAADLFNALQMNVCIAAMASKSLFCLEQPGQGISRAELLTSAANAMGVQPADCLVLSETPVGGACRQIDRHASARHRFTLEARVAAPGRCGHRVGRVSLSAAARAAPADMR